jgi:thiamine biosynthesis lipoprotein
VIPARFVGITRMVASVVATTFALTIAAGCAQPTRRNVATDGRYVMGTVLEIELHDTAGDRVALDGALEAAFARAVRLDQLMSRFDPESDVSRLNARAGGGAVQVDDSVREILERSRVASFDTHGAFDVTVGPIIALWTRAAHEGRVPGVAERQQAVSNVGAERIQIDPDGGVALSRPGMSIDLGGVAKGFALDRIATELARAGVANGLLSFGQSSVRALGVPPDAPAWRLLLRDPVRDFAGFVSLRDCALSVSSSLEPSSEIAGVRYGHVVDPRTGDALTSRRQAAVVAKSATTAEVLSTALLVLDEAEARAVVAQHGAEAYVVDEAGRSWRTPGFTRETAFEETAFERDLRSLASERAVERGCWLTTANAFPRSSCRAVYRSFLSRFGAVG